MSEESWPKRGEVWRHSTRGSLYEVRGVFLRQADGPTDGELVVVYVQLDESLYLAGFKKVTCPEWLKGSFGCSRPLEEWTEIVHQPSGSLAPRFTRVASWGE